MIHFDKNLWVDFDLKLENDSVYPIIELKNQAKYLEKSYDGILDGYVSVKPNTYNSGIRYVLNIFCNKIEFTYDFIEIVFDDIVNIYPFALIYHPDSDIKMIKVENGEQFIFELEKCFKHDKTIALLKHLIILSQD